MPTGSNYSSSCCVLALLLISVMMASHSRRGSTSRRRHKRRSVTRACDSICRLTLNAEAQEGRRQEAFRQEGRCRAQEVREGQDRLCQEAVRSEGACRLALCLAGPRLPCILSLPSCLTGACVCASASQWSASVDAAPPAPRCASVGAFPFAPVTSARAPQSPPLDRPAEGRRQGL